jgi:hypothetical protein
MGPGLYHDNEGWGDGMNRTSICRILEKYPNIRLATVEDNVEILNFTKSIPMRAGLLSLRYERSPDYFAQTRIQGDFAFVLVLSHDGVICGVTAISVKKIYCNGRSAQTGYFSDLRIKPNLPSSIRAQWRGVYYEIVNNFKVIDELASCDFLYAVVFSENQRMQQIFSDQSVPVIHEKIGEFWTYNLLARLPRLFRLKNTKIPVKNGLKVRYAKVSDLSALKQHLNKENHPRALGHYFSGAKEDEFEKRLDKWDDFDIASFIVTENSMGEIVGCVYPWSAASTKRLIVDSLPTSITLLGQLMPLFGKPTISIGHELKVLYLTHLEISSFYSDQERQTIFESMLDFIYENNQHRDFHMMSFADFTVRPVAGGLKHKGFLAHRILSSVFQIIPKSHGTDPFRISRLKNQQMSYELAVV